MSSKTEIANLAISHLGVGNEISNLETDRSEEAIACRRFYDLARQATLVAMDWPWATRQATLSLVEEDPTTEWAFSYRYPANCLKIRRVLSGKRQDTLASKVPFLIVSDDTGKLIYTDMEDAIVEITYDVEDVQLFPAQFQLALSFKLASYVVPRINGGDPFKTKSEMLGQFDLEIGKAKADQLNEMTPDQKPDSPLLQSRY